MKEYKKNEDKLSIFIGSALILMAIFCFISILSYHASDNCINVASSETIRNLGGSYGAIVADLLLQTTGLASAVFVGIIITWGIGLFMQYSIPFFWMRIPTMCIAIISFATMLGSLSQYNFAMQMLPGGYIGYFVFNAAASKIHWSIVILISLIVFLVFLYLSIILNRAAAANIVKTARNTTLVPINLISSTASTLYKLITLQFLMHAIKNRKKLAIVVKEMLYDGNKILSKKQIISSCDKKQISESQSAATKTDSNIDFVSQFTKRKAVSSYVPPRPELLTKAELQTAQDSRLSNIGQKTEKLIKVLEEFGIKGKIAKYHQGPVVTLFELQPQPGTKSSRIVGLASDVARTMEANSARISTLAGKDAIGIELPNEKRQKVFLRQLIESAGYTNSNAAIPMILGKNVMNDSVIVDLVKMPHLLIAGTTGSGKSVGVNCMILSIMYKLSPERCKFIMIDPKMLEFSSYDGIPHLLSPVITDSSKAVLGLKWVVGEMENRYKIMSSLGIRNINSYNDKVTIAQSRNGQLVREIDMGYDHNTGEIKRETVSIEAKYMPYIVVIIDEMADLMLVAGKEVESLIQRLAQMARAAGIHLIMATQRPSVDVITGVIKANFPTRISYCVTSKIDSRTILGEQGAEQLLGQGDMLYMIPGGKVTRVHGPFVSDSEVNAVVTYLKSQYRAEYIDITAPNVMNEYDVSNKNNDINSAMRSKISDNHDNALYQQALSIVLQDKKTSISYIQRKLRIGYNKAANLIEHMEENGILSAPDSTGRRMIISAINNADET